MLVISSHVLSDNMIGIQVEARDSSEIEIRLAYEALAKVVDGLDSEENREEKVNGQ